MASFQALMNRISQLSRDMGDALQLRGFKTGGTTGQVPIKNSSTAFDWSWGTPAGSGSGSVTSVSVVTANGVSASVANATTTPAITITLGAITPSSVSSSGNVTGLNLSGTNTGDETLSSIKTKLGITVLSGNNTGDQDLSGYLTSSAAASTYAPLAGPTFTGTVTTSGLTVSGLIDAGDFTANGTTGDVVFGSASLITFDSISYTYGAGAAAAHRTALGLGNVDNTSDATKNAAVATLTNKTINGGNNTLQRIPVTYTNTTDFTTTSTTFVDVTGLSFPVLANKKYAIALWLVTNKNDINGMVVQFTGPASPTKILTRITSTTSNISNTTTDYITAFSTPTSILNSFVGDGYSTNFNSGLISNGGNSGTVQLQLRAVTAGTAKIYAGSWIQVTQLD